MEKNRLKRYRPSTGDRSLYHHDTSAVNDLAEFKSSATLGNLADVMKNGPVAFPNILAPDSIRHIAFEKIESAGAGSAGGKIKVELDD